MLEHIHADQYFKASDFFWYVQRLDPNNRHSACQFTEQ
jgi:hypothetical protein